MRPFASVLGRATVAFAAAVTMAVSSVVVGAAPAAASHRPDRYVLPGAAVFPEGIAADQRTGTFWVSSTTDGTIFRGTVHDPTAEVFLPGGTAGRTTVIGLEYDRGLLYVAGGATGQVWVYRAYSGRLVARLDTGLTGTFINDVTIGRDGAAYFTDSRQPYIYRVARKHGRWTLQRWLDYSTTVIPFVVGFNLNGIDASPGGRYLYAIHSSTGRLFRIDTVTKRVREVDLGGVALTAGDGVEVRGRTIYVVRNAVALIAKVVIVPSARGTVRGVVVSQTTHPSLRFPTTAEVLRGRLLVVNSQFNRRGPGLTPELPFTVSAIRLP